MRASGKVEVVTGTLPHGQGHVTAWSQITADALGVDVDDVEVFHGDTAMAPYGRDTYGSRSLPVGGVAVHLAAEEVIEKAKKVAPTCWRPPTKISSSRAERSRSRALRTAA